MSSQPVSRAEHWLISFALAALFGLALLAVGLLGAGLGVRYGVVLGPAVDLDLGPVRVVTGTNQAPNCNPADPICAAQRLPPAGGPRYYSLWVVTKTKTVTASGGPEQYGGSQVFAIQAGP